MSSYRDDVRDSILPELRSLGRLQHDRPYTGTYMLCLDVVLPIFNDFPGIEAASGNKRRLEEGLLAALVVWYRVLRFGLISVLSAVLQI